MGVMGEYAAHVLSLKPGDIVAKAKLVEPEEVPSSV
jgi:hypothetical protein